ncbi:MAG TPA: hypothetical protein VJ698_22625 [Noviherbaspirillum sp.]|uniref:hypothetical protein n=1 Tax=Noviherbaspirillum sp. TaxID=1926288 RepID=UPI002B473579|nr:hypothetical protein [Noviherbaspirillum sp.]HJV88282.1 hypothetical protein [Noviherbaspirillum sp.]
MNQGTARSITIFDVPIAENIAILKPEQVVLRFAHTATFDIGALCFLRRESTPKNSGKVRRSTEGRKVVLSSLCPQRVEHVHALIIHISNEVRFGKRPLTMLEATRKIAMFVNWADENGHSSYFIDPEATRRAVRAYAAHIRERVVTHSISLHAGVALQRRIITHLGELLGIENLGRGINLLRMDFNTVTATAPPCEMNQARTLALCEALFTGLSGLVLDRKPYPLGISMPLHLAYPEDTMWVFPSNVWCMPASNLESNGRNFRRGGFDYRSGRLVTRDEILASDRVDRKKRANGVLSLAQNALDSANSDPYHRHRRFMGIVALNAFIHLFLSRTGMNWAQAVDMQWFGSYGDTSSSIRQKFRSIKFRAGGKEVYYQLPLKFMPLFKRFLQLREYLLQGHPEFEGLFFNLGMNSAGAPGRIKSAMPGISTMLRRIDPSFVQIRSRAWRAAKSDWLITRTDLSTTARLLQNSERTVLKSYAAGSVESHQVEMSAFLDGIVISSCEVLADRSVSAVGACTSHANPKEVSALKAVVAPNCESPEAGCLFCDKFRIHADEIDVRKLLSCRYTLARTSHLAGVHSISEPLINRIELILEEVRLRDSLLVLRITKEVEEGELDPYWASKYDLLLKLRLVHDID